MYFKGNYRFLAHFDVADLKAYILGLPNDAWERDTFRRHYVNFRECKSIELIWQPKDRQFKVEGSRWWNPANDGFLPYVAPIFDFAKAHYDGVIIRAYITLLPPGGRVPEHTDAWPDPELEHPSNYLAHRLHMPIRKAAGVEMTVGGEAIDPAEGDLYEYNNYVRHSAFNGSNDDRLLMVLDVVSRADFGKFWSCEVIAGRRVDFTPRPPQ